MAPNIPLKKGGNLLVGATKPWANGMRELMEKKVWVGAGREVGMLLSSVLGKVLQPMCCLVFILIVGLSSALRKTAHLLTALASSLPDPSSNASTLPPPITYHPLDLSYPELNRVLGEMHEAIGDKIEGKVACVGLHGDYEAGLQFIRDGKLAQMRKSLNDKPENFAEELFVSSTASSAPQTIPADNQTYQEDSPILSPSSIHLVTPRDAPCPLPAMDPRIVQGDSSPNSYSSEPSDEHMPALKEINHPRSAAREAPAPRISSYPAEADRPLHFIFLGSSLGNFERPSAAPFLKSLPLRAGDTLLLGLDGRPTPGEEGNKKVEIAYNDPAGHTKRFEEHGWDIVKRELGVKGDAEFVGRYNEELGESLWK